MVETVSSFLVREMADRIVRRAGREMGRIGRKRKGLAGRVRGVEVLKSVASIVERVRGRVCWLLPYLFIAVLFLSRGWEIEFGEIAGESLGVVVIETGTNCEVNLFLSHYLTHHYSLIINEMKADVGRRKRLTKTCLKGATYYIWSKKLQCRYDSSTSSTVLHRALTHYAY